MTPPPFSSLAEAWQLYSTVAQRVAPMPPAEVEQRRRAFYAGAGTLIDLATQQGGADDRETFARLNGVAAELEQHARELRGERSDA